MDAVIIIQVQQAPMREVIRDRRGGIVGVIERQLKTGKLIARDRHGIVAGQFDQLSNTTRDARGRTVGRTNLLPALLFTER